MQMPLFTAPRANTDGADGTDGPSLALDRAFADALGGGPIAGVDEAGRGPWAGPVVAAAVVLDPAAVPPGLDDSKKLSAARRAILFDAVLKQAVAVGVGQASVEEIDRLNILAASHLAMRRAVDDLAVRPAGCLIDGNRDPELDLPARPIVKGDARSVSIAAASIVAKVRRDRIMADLARAYPAYGWERNAGYGVPAHRDALNRVGPCVHHRKSFAPIRDLIVKDS